MRVPAGKTTVTRALADALGAALLRSPPAGLSPWRQAFDEEPDMVRRAFYSLGNYIAASEIAAASARAPVVVDRWARGARPPGVCVYMYVCACVCVHAPVCACVHMPVFVMGTSVWRSEGCVCCPKAGGHGAPSTVLPSSAGMRRRRPPGPCAASPGLWSPSPSPVRHVGGLPARWLSRRACAGHLPGALLSRNKHTVTAESDTHSVSPARMCTLCGLLKACLWGHVSLLNLHAQP